MRAVPSESHRNSVPAVPHKAVPRTDSDETAKADQNRTAYPSQQVNYPPRPRYPNARPAAFRNVVTIRATCSPGRARWTV